MNTSYVVSTRSYSDSENIYVYVIVASAIQCKEKNL